jgi:hypothetical protein
MWNILDYYAIISSDKSNTVTLWRYEMGNINDFKLIKLKSKKMFQYIYNTWNINLEETAIERLGFYHLILENVTGFTDFNTDENEEESCVIIDTNYNKILNNLDVDDLGIDAIYITKAESNQTTIKLFNFKYRDNFNPDKTKSEGDISRSTKFLEYIINGEKLDESANTLVHTKINEIINLLNSNKICNLELYMVSNEANGFAPNSNDYIHILEKSYGMKLINISLDDIVAFFNEKKDNHRSCFMISLNEFLSFQSDERSTQKSYIIKLSLLDLIRISSDNEIMCNNYSLENDNEILNSRLDYSLLYDNVRAYLGDTKYNKNIIDTLKVTPKYFFMYNNGITITAENIDCDSKNSGMKYLFSIGNFQIVNGGQTLRSIFNYLNNSNDTEKVAKLREAYVLVRIFKINKGDTLQNLIAEYTNSQNAISDVDLKSVDAVQIQIEKYFSELNILYTRKSGIIGNISQDYSYRISIEKLAQILYSDAGHPDRASNQKRRLFQDYYDEIFKSNSFSLEKCKVLSDKYFTIESIYKGLSDQYKLSDQKIFYVLYITTNTENSIEDAIKVLEELLISYPADVASARKLIQKGFKNHIDRELGIHTEQLDIEELLELIQ